MSKFKVGDWVKCLEDYDRGRQFTKGGFYQVKSAKDNWLMFYYDDKGSPSSGWSACKFEPAYEPAYTSCAAAEVDNLAAEYGGGKVSGFKKGDRVFYSAKSTEYNEPEHIGKLGTVSFDTIGELTTVDWDLGIAYRPSSGVYTDNLEHVAVAPATATLHIHAGKFYKTRDGRKVGPMMPSNGMYSSEFAFTVDHSFGHGFGKAWRADGTYHPDTGERCDEDLIAEWTDAPTTIADIVARHSQSGTAIVAVLENGQPRPATRPYVHTTASAAETEASRLARTNPGTEFGVYTLGAVAKVEKTYDHEWQRLAASGRKIDAIKELRRLAGMNLKPAKDAVEDWLHREDLMRAA